MYTKIIERSVADYYLMLMRESVASEAGSFLARHRDTAAIFSFDLVQRAMSVLGPIAVVLSS